ncbi:alpha/beta hydrolase [Archangium sp.]|uniref:alpha/beta hydrolase n=1 Tax=Archangium sp. TaxID=1872627 RepID=UPI002D5435CD|nr:alpha/beta fold hydrolase [Archangium sp.]HYO51756.1 alpha/beta fold hydrolase [Archangium sp.]
MRQPLFRQRWFRLAALVLVLLGVGWAGSGALVTWRLTRRARPVFAEPAPALARGAIEEHRIVAADGLGVGAWLVRGEPGSPCVLMLHGNGGSRTSLRSLLEELVGQGHCVLALSLRTHGDSEGEVNDFGWSARQDVLAGIAFLERQAPDRPRVVFGTSLGAAAAIFASQEVGSRVQGYVLESPYRDLRTAVGNRLESYLLPGLDRLAFHGMWLFGDALLPVPAEQLRPIDHVAGIPQEVPVLFLAGAKDRHARLFEVEALAGRISSHARLEVFREGNHGTLRASEPERYQRLLLDFIRASVRR